MSTRLRTARKGTASTFSYAEPPTSSDEGEGESSKSGRGGGGRYGNKQGPTKRRKVKDEAVDVDSGDEGDEDDQPRKKARTPAKGKQSKQKKGTGKLEVLKTLPIEMLTEILSHLYPNDLLALSMVNKQYRALLTAKSSSRLWKAARDKLELPDVVTEHFTEVQYASLVFGRKCQLCKVGKYVWVEPRLRIRYCKSCRTQHVVKLSALGRTHPELLTKLHPRAQEAVIQSRGQVLLSDMHRATVILRDLEDQDEDDYIAEGNAAPLLLPPAPTPSSTRRRSSRAHSSKTWTPRRNDTSDSEDESASPYTRRVNEYLIERTSLFDEINQHARSIAQAFKKAKDHACEVAWEGSRQQYNGRRRAELKEKILGLDLGYEWRDFGASWSRSKLVKSKDPLTSDEWERIKPELLALVDRDKERQVKRSARWDAEQKQVQRQNDLRPFYNELYKSLPKSARPFVPLFLDFLALPAVKALWVGDDDVTEQAWTGAAEDIKEDLEQFRLDLVAHARTLILDATADPDERSTAEDDLDLDAFLSLATSSVCCDAYCRRPPKHGYFWPPRRELSSAYRKFRNIGPLVDVLKHLHKNHNKAHAIYRRADVPKQPQFHISLPLEVACATSALVEVNQLDPATAGVAELDRAGKGVRKYVWHSHTSSWRNYSGELAWFDLLYAVKKEGAKLARLKPPVYLDPPVVVMHPIRGYRAPDVDDENDQE